MFSFPPHKLYIYLFDCVEVWWGRGTYRSHEVQRTTCRCGFPPSTVWIVGDWTQVASSKFLYSLLARGWSFIHLLYRLLRLRQSCISFVYLQAMLKLTWNIIEHI